jgi:uncharacterized membrane protein YcaP (DUF421 family)
VLLIGIRAIILYLFVFVTVRIMGKRELGQLQPYEFVIAILMADLAATPMEDPGIPILQGIVPIASLLFIYLLLSWLMLKNEKARSIICGSPAVIIARGRILEHEMRRARYNFSDLLEQTREKGFFSLADIEYAILETSGMLTVIPRQDKGPLTAGDMGIYNPQREPSYHLIMDGRIHRQSLHESGHTEQWLRDELAKLGYTDPRNVFYATLEPDGMLRVQGREKKGRWFGA